MKIIDLLVKAFKGEEMPKIIKYDYHTYIYNESYNSYYQVMSGGNKLFISFDNLNDEVEIIEDTPEENKPEEDKKIEKLELLQFSDLIDMSKEEIIQVIKEQRFKINEIIDKVNGDSNERNK